MVYSRHLSRHTRFARLSDFVGIDSEKTVQKCKLQNQTIAEQKLAQERRRQAHEESRSNRQKQATAGDEDGNLEKLLTDLRNGETISRKSRRRRPAPEPQLLTPLALTLDGSNDASHIAQDMLAKLQSDGFTVPSLTTATSPPPRRQRQRRRTKNTLDSEEMSGSPLAIEIQNSNEDFAPETQNLMSGTP